MYQLRLIYLMKKMYNYLLRLTSYINNNNFNEESEYTYLFKK